MAIFSGNDIHSNCEAAVDIRKNADPIVQVSADTLITQFLSTPTLDLLSAAGDDLIRLVFRW